MKRILAIILILGLALAGCAPSMGPKETGGTLLGAGTGALAGSQIGSGRGTLVAVAVGTLAGALIGQGIGQSLDRADQLMMERNAQYALENTRTNVATTWRNPDSGNYGSITPVETYQTRQGRYCREYTQLVVVGGRNQQAYGTACRQPDGSWLIVK
jgi:surface antigen